MWQRKSFHTALMRLQGVSRPYIGCERLQMHSEDCVCLPSIQLSIWRGCLCPLRTGLVYLHRLFECMLLSLISEVS